MDGPHGREKAEIEMYGIEDICPECDITYLFGTQSFLQEGVVVGNVKTKLKIAERNMFSCRFIL